MLFYACTGLSFRLPKLISRCMGNNHSNREEKMEKIGAFMFAFMVVGGFLSVIPYLVSGAVRHCAANEQCDNGNRCDGSEFCFQGVCHSTEVNPCERIGRKYCVDEKDNLYFCLECKDDNDCSRNQYCDQYTRQCKTKVKTNYRMIDLPNSYFL